jgi:photosystem II stability/assembly factor-like uncharacterized protein
LSSTTGRTGLGIALTALILAACVPQGPTGGLPPAASPAPQLAFTTGTLQVQTGESRSLAQLLSFGNQPIDAVTLGLLAFQVGDPGVASVGADGTLKGLKAGNTTVTATNKLQPSQRAQLNLNVVANGSAVQIQIKPETAVLGIGETLPLVAEVHLATGEVNANVDWSSSDDTIATVNRTTGVVSGVKEGRVTIRAAYTQDAAFSQVADVRVVKDKTQAVPSAAPSVKLFGPSPTPTANGPTPTPAPLGAWVRQSSGATEDFTSVRFLDARTGFAMGAGGILAKTTDGAKWTTSAPVSLGFQQVDGFDFGSATVGVAIAAGKAYRTANGGEEWTALALPAGQPRKVRFASATSVDLLLDANLYHSDDAGATWTKQDTPSATNFYRRGSKLWLVQDALLFRQLPEGGWVNTNAFLGTVSDLKFVSDQAGFLWNQQSLVATQDGGANVSRPIGGAGQAVDFADAQHGLALISQVGGTNAAGQRLTDYVITATNDGGVSWGSTTIAPSGSLSALAYPAPGAAWVVGAKGQIYKFEAAQ